MNLLGEEGDDEETMESERGIERRLAMECIAELQQSGSEKL